jgi:hypothetical protein
MVEARNAAPKTLIATALPEMTEEEDKCLTQDTRAAMIKKRRAFRLVSSESAPESFL